MRDAERRERHDYLLHAGQHAEETALFLDALANSSADELREVVRMHDSEAAIAAATRLLAVRFRVTVIGDGPDAEFFCGRHPRPRAKQADGRPAAVLEA